MDPIDQKALSRFCDCCDDDKFFGGLSGGGLSVVNYKAQGILHILWAHGF